MKITNKNIIGLPVKTESGQLLGKVKSFNIDTDSQSILDYDIKPTSIVKEFFEGDFIISRGSVVDITSDTLIVSDTFSKKENLVKLKQALERKKSVAINKD
jgi:sporulation protein YlmC with PRC-barrel domain